MNEITIANGVDLMTSELASRSNRIRQLERLNAVLSAEIDRQRPLIEAVRPWRHTFEIYKLDTIVEALDAYEASGEGADGQS